MASAQGEDRSSYQSVMPWTGLDFGFCKATEGLGYTDPYFAANWANLASEGKPRGAYHELNASASPQGQAAYFTETVKLHGLRPGDMLAVVASDFPGVTGAGVKTALDEVHRLAGPGCPVLVYSDLSFLPQLASCTGYGLWIAWPNPTAPVDVAPFRSWRFWQWGIDGTDRDAYNGTADELRAWIDGYAKPSPSPRPSPPPAIPQEEEVIEFAPGGHMLLIPWGCPSFDIDSAAPESAPATAEITWPGQGSASVTKTLSWGATATPAPEIPVPSGVKSARLVVTGAPVSIRWNT